MDFFYQEARARKQSRRLIWLFGLAVLMVVALTNLALAMVIHAFKHPLFPGVWWNPIIFLITLLDLCGEAVVFPVDLLKLIWNPYLFCWVTLVSLTSVSHLYFVNYSYDPWLNFQSTHPPLAKRILAIDPAFDGQFVHINSLPRQTDETSREKQYDRLYEESVRRAREEFKAREEQ